MKQVFTNFYGFDDVKISKNDLYVEDGIIVEEFSRNEADEIIDCNNLALMPSFTDMHVHFRDPGFTYKEDLETGSHAALKGGFTNVLLMGNTKPTVSSPEIYEDIMKRGKDIDLIGIDQVYTITKNFDGKTLDHLDTLPESVKFISDDGHGVDDDAIMYLAMVKAKKLGVNMTLHEEVAKVSAIDYEVAEDAMTLRDCYYAYKLDMPVHFSHVSTKGAMTAIKYFKDLGAKITCEVTPHHLYFSEKTRDEMKVNPPIRREEDRQFLLKMIKEGYVDAISTDHAPHSAEEKKNGAPGFIGIETAFSTCYEVLVKSGIISLNQLVKIMSTRPSELLNIKKGKLEPGYMADFTLVDLDKSYEYKEEDILSKSKNSLMIGKTLYGSIERVYRGGELKYENNR
ncbi:dihydroorotase [Anaerococcus lactolyticus]|uniref:Dihydroorotase n=1 Tax=Anaerococcus lactolyticus S7-1-13 TaxID=1284686 RepID=A0A095WZM9_9FIRM|nr:dihydroorotase [Anaerococcus lactolyticus]KGF03073.1 dihydroorotase [Anaerococcus lactolyticus S7-1-13]